MMPLRQRTSKEQASRACVLGAVLMLGLAGCNARSNKAGGDIAGPARTLTVMSGVGIKQQALDFADEVVRLSNGNLTIRFDTTTHPEDPHAEAEIIKDVRQGRAASALVGARVFDTLGINDFEPLIAPLVVDSYALEGAVFAAGIPQAMLQSVSRLGLVGIAILPGPLRRMFGETQPFLHPSDFAGKVVGIQESALARQTLAALGARAKPLPATTSLEGVDGYEQQLDSIAGSGYVKRGTYVTTNLVLWPRPLVLVMGQQAYASLSADQRGVLEEAAKRTIAPALAAARKEDADAMQVLCKSPASLEAATASDLGDFRAALAPVYSRLSAAPATRRWLDRIEALNRGLPPVAPTCPSPAEQAAGAPGELDGVWEVSFSRSEWIDAVGLSDAEVPAGLGGITVRLELRDRRFLLVGYPDGFDTYGTYGVDGKELRLRLPVTGHKDTGVWNLTWSVYRGALSLSGAEPYWIGLKPWRRIGDAQASDYVVQPVTSLPPNGVYEHNATVAGFLRKGADLGYAEGNATDYRVAWRDGRWSFVSCAVGEPCGGRYWLKGGLLHFAWAHEGPGSTETWSFDNGVLSFHHVGSLEEVGDVLNSGASWRKIG
jgi:TRAP-type C4-dicarboxylate transport system substrate-binding protein